MRNKYLLAKYAHTDLNHDEQRYVEATEGRVDLVEKILADRAVRGPGFGIGVLVSHYQQGRQTDTSRS